MGLGFQGSGVQDLCAQLSVLLYEVSVLRVLGRGEAGWAAPCKPRQQNTMIFCRVFPQSANCMLVCKSVPREK